MGRMIRRMADALSLVVDRKVSIDFPSGRMSPRVRFDGADVPIQYLGEGLRRTVSWLVDLLVRLERTNWVDTSRAPTEQAFWLLLDEVDEALHPSMQARLLPAIRDLFPNARIYATTHSPFVVGSVDSGCVFRLRARSLNPPGKGTADCGSIGAWAVPRVHRRDGFRSAYWHPGPEDAQRLGTSQVVGGVRASESNEWIGTNSCS